MRRKHQRPAPATDRGAGWSSRQPADPPLSPRMSAAEARDAVHDTVTAMHGTGSLDAGNGDVLDAWIDSLRPQWTAHHAMAGAEAEALAQLAAGRYEAAAVAARGAAATKQAERDHAQRLVAVYEQRLLAPTEVPSTGAPDRRRRPRPALDPLEGLTPQRGWRVVSVLLLLLATAGDLAAFYVTLAGMTGQRASMVWTLTVALAAAAVGIMHLVGRTARNLREGQGGLGRTALALMTCGWAALGAATFTVRTQVEVPAVTGGQVAFGGAAAEVPGDDPLLSALLLAALYVGSGILAFWIGFSDHHPRMQAYLRLRRDLAARRREADAAEAAAAEAERLAADARAEVERTAARSAAATAGVDAEIAELKELARLSIARLLGDPAATGSLVSGRAEPAARPAEPATAVPRLLRPADPASLNGNGSSPHAGAR